MEILDPQPAQDPQPTNNRRRRDTGALVIGLIFIFLGVIFGLSKAGIMSYQWRHVILSWPLLLIFFSIVMFCKRQTAGGIIFLVIGGVFLLPRLASVIPGIPWLGSFHMRDYWPLVLVAIGLIILVSARKKNRDVDYGPNGKRSNYTSQDGRVNIEYVFSGAEQVFMEPVFRGGKIETVFGGTTLDLRRTSLPSGETHLAVECLFGGATILVPDNWYVEICSSSVFGAFSDKRTYIDTSTQDKTRKLVIDAECVFAGGDLKN